MNGIDSLQAQNAELKARLHMFESLIDQALDAVIISDLLGKLQYVNTAMAQIAGYPDPATMLAQTSSNAGFFSAEEQQRFMTEVVPQVMQHGRYTWIDWSLRADGQRRLYQNVSLLLRNQAGEPVALAGFLRDLTESYEAEQERLAMQESIIQAQQATLRELSTPLIPIADRVVALPLVGTIDSMRAQQVMETLLSGVSARQADFAIIDITGVKVVDTQVANALIRTSQALSLLGTRAILTGIGPEIAQTLVSLGTNLQGIITFATLQGAITYALHRNAHAG